MTNFARAERAGLAATLEAIGPDAPTLCAGWTTTDLVLHLVLRDRADPAQFAERAPGPLGAALERRRRSTLALHGFTGLIDVFRNGPPTLSPFSLPGAEARANTVEFYVHHEDVRRAQPGWEPRVLSNEFEGTLFATLSTLGRLMVRRVSAGVQVATPDGLAATLKKGVPVATVSGPASEAVLYLFGRRADARVAILGDEGAREALAQAKLGI